MLYQGRSVLRAQNNTLNQCFEEQINARHAVVTNKLPNQSASALGVLFDPTQQKLQQIDHDWAECVKGHPIPLSTFKTLTGESYDSASLAGNIVVINFWFMGCAPCRSEMPALNRLVDEYKGKNVLFLGFTPDRSASLKPDFFQQNRFDFTIVPDAKNMASSFHFMGYPTTYVVDQRGIIREAWLGGGGLNKLYPYYKAKTAIDTLLLMSSK
ncbi:peroxiredoxin family protein [Spirosoma migulaei]